MTTTITNSCSPPQSPSTKTVRLMIKGRVQGVFYRNWTVENATHYRRDGSVEALFSGDSDNVQEM
ncbi:acylphosphatase [Salix suchowensis]|nr:acylphosphatase [Salix suchowensis]